jgi:hypothetical protein
MLRHWKDLRHLPRGIWVLFATTLTNRAGSMVMPFLVLYLTRSLGFSAGRAAFVLLVYGLGAIVAGPISGLLSDRLGPVRVMEASLFLSGCALLAYPFAKTYGSVLVVTVVLASVTECFRPASMAMIAATVRPDQRKAAFALYRLAINLGMSVGPALGGLPRPCRSVTSSSSTAPRRSRPGRARRLRAPGCISRPAEWTDRHRLTRAHLDGRFLFFSPPCCRSPSSSSSTFRPCRSGSCATTGFRNGPSLLFRSTPC